MTTLEERKRRKDECTALFAQFRDAALPLVKTIVRDVHIPTSQKAIKPVDVGGVAGGEKYMQEHMFFKFSRDATDIMLYGGDVWAQKAAGHELKALNALISASVANLHFPLMCLVTYRGHRVVVVSRLPLGEKTLIWGSEDAANVIHTDARFLVASTSFPSFPSPHLSSHLPCLVDFHSLRRL